MRMLLRLFAALGMFVAGIMLFGGVAVAASGTTPAFVLGAALVAGCAFALLKLGEFWRAHS